MSDEEPVCDLHVVTDGEDGLRFLGNQPPYQRAPAPDLVLLDLNLPRVPGYDLLEEVKEDPELCRVPVVVFTSSDSPEDVERSYRLHANTFVTKPSDVFRYVQALRELEEYWLEAAHLPTHGDGRQPRSEQADGGGPGA